MLIRSFMETGDVDLLITGDFCPIFPTSASSLKIGERLLSMFAQAAYRSVNLECPLTSCDQPIRKSGPAIKASTDAVELLRSMHVDLCNLANNHIMDYGASGVNETVDLLKSSGIGWTGIDSGNATEPCIVQLKGKRVAFVSFTENEFSTLDRSNRKATGLDYYLQYRQIKRASQLADHVIVQYHGGAENYGYPSPGQKKYAHFLVDLGASIVICHHSHCLSGYEVYANVPIFYGLGNFYFPLRGRAPGWYKGLVVCVSLYESLQTTAIPVDYDPAENVLELVNLDDSTRQLIENMNRIIASDDLLLEQWGAFCSREELSTLAMIRGTSKLERFLIRKGFIKRSRKPGSADLGLFNRIRCETHREKLLTIMMNQLFPGTIRTPKQ